MFEVQAETDIAAPAAIVWDVLTKVAEYRTWSTMLNYHGGELRVGATIQLGLTPPNATGYNFAPQVITLEHERHFAWRAITLVRGVFDGEHHFEILPLDAAQSRLRNYERYSGLLSPIFQRLPMMRDASAGFEAMNQEIRARAEALWRQQP
jgi:hypothetical protein